MTEFEKVMGDIAWKNYETELSRRRDLDTKAALLVSTAGLLVTLSIRPANFEASSPSILGLLFVLGIFFMALAAISGIFSLWIRKYETPDTWKLIEEFKDKEILEQIRGIVVTLTITQKSSMKINDKKAKYLKIGYIFLVVGFVFLIPSSLGIFFSIKI